MTNPAFCCRGWGSSLIIEAPARKLLLSAAAPYLLVSLHIGALDSFSCTSNPSAKNLGAASRL